MLKRDIKIGDPLFVCVPMIDTDSDDIEWEPHQTRVVRITKDRNGELFINDSHHSLYFEDYDEAFSYCTELNKNQSGEL